MVIIRSCFLLALNIFVISAFAMPSQIIIFPHADKETNGPHLSAQGVKQAKNLQNFILQSDKLKPNIVIANSTPQQRALGSIETCAPIALALNIPLNSQFLESQAADMMTKILTDPVYNHKKILICWDKRDIPMMDGFIKANKNMQTTLLHPEGYATGYLFSNSKY